MEALRVELTAELEAARARPRRRQHCHSTLSLTDIDPSLRPFCTVTRDRRISHVDEEGRSVMGGAAPLAQVRHASLHAKLEQARLATAGGAIFILRYPPSPAIFAWRITSAIYRGEPR